MNLVELHIPVKKSTTTQDTRKAIWMSFQGTQMCEKEKYFAGIKTYLTRQ